MARGRGWIDGWMDECLNERMDGWWKDGSMDVGSGWMNKRTEGVVGWIDGWVWGYNVGILSDFS
jgi:hypothetical protein